MTVDARSPLHMRRNCQTWTLPAPYFLWDSHAAGSSQADTLLTLSVPVVLRDGETELVSDALEQQPAQVKLLYAGSAAGIIILGASAVCWLTGNDLLGGASLSPHSLKAAEVHALPVTRRLAHHDILLRLCEPPSMHRRLVNYFGNMLQPLPAVSG